MIIIFAFYILLALGFALFFVGLIPAPVETVSVFGEKLKEEKKPLLEPFLTPLAPLNQAIVKFLKMEKSLNHKIYIAKWKVTPAQFLAGKELLAATIVFLLIFLDIRKPWLLILSGLLGFLIPDFVLNSKVKKRKYQIVRVLPETVDLLGLCVGAGLDFMAAVRWVIDKVKINPLIEELVIVLKEINLGKPRVEALRDMSKRLDIPDITSFVRTLVQADRMGAPVEEAFKILSEDTRMRRFHRGERQAMKAPLKMLIPLIFCIFPVIMIIIAGPILIRFMTEGIFQGGPLLK
jgi:tight adherence protein C